MLSKRREFLKGSVAAAALSSAHTAIAQTPRITGGTQSSFPSPAAPGSNEGGYNVLFILTDQEQYMGPQWPIALPGHERLRRTGTYFENHHIAANMCSASRAVIYTGLHMPSNRIFDNAGVPYMKSLDPKLPTIGKILRKLGYYPAYKGKWHLNAVMAMENRADDNTIVIFTSEPRRITGLARRAERQGHDGLPPAEPRAAADRASQDQGRPALP